MNHEVGIWIVIIVTPTYTRNPTERDEPPPTAMAVSRTMEQKHASFPTAVPADSFTKNRRQTRRRNARSAAAPVTPFPPHPLAPRGTPCHK